MSDEVITKTVQGIFKDNKITTISGEIVECITYGSVRKEIENKEGYLHLKWSEPLQCWVLFQYILLA